ncbi:MAG: phosphatidylserine decarboxylase family protein [Deltaproteobacteria bacterium]|nr:phosphatidylserine decarboxylase family protein [Deltaproteobacteria bacterium]
MNGVRYMERRINNSLPVAREGLPFIFGSVLLTTAFLLAGPLFLLIPAAVVTLFIVYFFRDPDRENPGGEKVLGEPAIKVSVFMSLFDVHVNRIPVSGRILEVKYRPGRFFSANLDKASEENEHNQVTLETGRGHRVVFVQIAGLIARRIVCWIRSGDVVSAGQRCGLIRFGSRLDVYVPAESRLAVKVRDRVKAGETILGYLP